RPAPAVGFNRVTNAIRPDHGARGNDSRHERLRGNDATGGGNRERGGTVAADPELQGLTGQRGVRGRDVEIVGAGRERDGRAEVRVRGTERGNAGRGSGRIV